MKREVERPCLPICYNIVTPHYLFFLFWAAAPEGQMTYDSTQGDFLGSERLDLRSGRPELGPDRFVGPERPYLGGLGV